MKKAVLKILLYFMLITLGVLMFIYAEIDDSPGGQMLGLIFAIVGTYKLIKAWRTCR